MYYSSYIALFSSLALVLLRGARCVDTATVSITNEPAYSVEPACVQSCVFYNSFDVADYLLFALGCTSTIYNECYCTQIADQSASSALSGCVNTLCRGTTDVSNAISLYENYCDGAGYPRTASATQTTSSTSSPTSQSASATPPSTTSAPTPTNTSPSLSSTSPSSTPSATTSSSQQSSSSSTSTTSSASSKSTSSGSKSKTDSIVGVIAGGLAALAIIVAL